MLVDKIIAILGRAMQTEITTDLKGKNILHYRTEHPYPVSPEMSERSLLLVGEALSRNNFCVTVSSYEELTVLTGQYNESVVTFQVGLFGWAFMVTE